MRLSKPDKDDASKRRHFEISIDSPFHILSCRANQANIALPAYSSPDVGDGTAKMTDCGCPGAPRRRISPSSVPTLNSFNDQRGTDAGLPPSLARPQQVHLGGNAAFQQQRPIHMLRAPSFNPPAFEDVEPPPPLITPPPEYNDIASPSSGLADYFSRLADTYSDTEQEDSDGGSPRSSIRGRVNVPLTPGSRVNRSMDLNRRWVPVGQ